MPTPIIYLSPSTQDWNEYVNGGTEEYYMNLVADDMEPYLRSSGVRFTRNTPDMTAASSIAQSNAGNYDLHLALHSNAAPEGQSGQHQGGIVFYAPGSTRGHRAAEIIAKNLRSIYPNPALVRTEPTTYLGEVTKTRAPAVLVEFAFHDNPEDANWIKANIPELARVMALSVTEYFGVPLVTPQAPRPGVVRVQSGSLNLRERPSTSANVDARMPNGSPVTILGQWEGWDVVEFQNQTGYAAARYIQAL